MTLAFRRHCGGFSNFLLPIGIIDSFPACKAVTLRIRWTPEPPYWLQPYSMGRGDLELSQNMTSGWSRVMEWLAKDRFIDQVSHNGHSSPSSKQDMMRNQTAVMGTRCRQGSLILDFSKLEILAGKARRGLRIIRLRRSVKT